VRAIDLGKKLAVAAVDFAARHSQRVHRDTRNVDICLAALCGGEALAEIAFPSAYVELIRSCIEETRCSVREIKSTESVGEKNECFSTLLEVLCGNLPPLEFHVARTIAMVADRYRSRRQALQSGWDVSHHFQVASSFGKKGRILSAIIRFTRAERCLELGTAYGMSAMFILEAMKANQRAGHLWTVEGWEPLHALSSPMLAQRYGSMVSCRLGYAREELPLLTAGGTEFDFLFHDAGHSREDYIRDFNAAKQNLRSGAVVLVDDDIRYENPPGGGKSQLHSYEGWTEICSQPKVARAVEIDSGLGLLLIR
jgi:predicted O-methyltransferase YrrM